jgi:hypothetical protein
MRQEQKKPVTKHPHIGAEQSAGVGDDEIQVPMSGEALAEVDAALAKARELEQQLLQASQKRGCCGCGC